MPCRAGALRIMRPVLVVNYGSGSACPSNRATASPYSGVVGSDRCQYHSLSGTREVGGCRRRRLRLIMVQEASALTVRLRPLTKNVMQSLSAPCRWKQIQLPAGEAKVRAASATAYLCGAGLSIRRGERHMRIVRLIICMGLLTYLLSTNFMGCGFNSPPVKSLDQWEQDINRTRSRE